MTAGEQLSLLGDATPRGPVRHALDAVSWVEHIPGWYLEHRELFAQLVGMPEWEQRRRWMYSKEVIEPRLTAEFPVLHDANVPGVRELGARLSAQYGIRYDSVWLNLYRDHEDSTGWHADKPCKREECVVPVLSLGATRRFQLRPKQGGRSTSLVVESGDLVVMGGRCQRDWVHCVPKQKEPAGARISINYASVEQA